jgi:lipoprotein-anchoring transpeptidase ErfK/SrfK
VTVTAHIAGYAAPDGAYGAKDVTITYSIGAAHVSTVDVNAHTMTVTENGAVVRVIKVSTGRDEFPTHGGIHVASEKANPKIMDSSTIGIPRNSPGGYYESVPWSVRISNSGEFVHAASWSTAAQGNRNVSHGCVNVSPADGEWFYGFTQIGDVVQVNGSPVPLQPTNGIGDWQIPWAQWAN